MGNLKPDERQQNLIDAALASHREVQSRGRYAPDRLVEKWSNESGIRALEGPPQPLRHPILSLGVLHSIEHLMSDAIKRITGH
ncbi:hypothetical protein B0G80_6034 [Paraburkholderia sp. BL6669N2]|uniref:hypothetical protein n=1 Tax=Paraburkholderia sp. BL6669N2 TaxID=1938807 RepID=UPI000E37F32A|nr:hypothetical protein [Paraburkholderia sp. BL6669N2]REG49636.1 hypothetical protein B0G80_6034 [Paraburkholderia sp. BL6669N2]